MADKVAAGRAQDRERLKAWGEDVDGLDRDPGNSQDRIIGAPTG